MGGLASFGAPSRNNDLRPQTLSELEERINQKLEEMQQATMNEQKAAEERLKVQLTKLEVAVLGAVEAHGGGGGGGAAAAVSATAAAAVAATAGTSSVSNLTSAAGEGVSSLLNRRSFACCGPTSSAASRTGAQIASEDSSVDDTDKVDLLQTLVEADAEVRTKLHELRRSARLAQLRVGSRPAKTTLKMQLSGYRSAAVMKRGPRGQRARELMRNVCGKVLHPDGQWRTIWNSAMAVLICYCGVVIPLEIAFEDDMVKSWCLDQAAPYGYRDAAGHVASGLRRECTGFQAWFWGNVFVDFLFLIDIMINLRTGFVVEGHFVDDDWKAVTNYLKGSFLFDVVGSFPLNLVFLGIDQQNSLTDEDQDSNAGLARTNKMLRLLRMAKLSRLTRMLKLGKYLEYVEVVVKFNPGLIRVFKLCLAIILCCHWFGCVWWLISDFEMGDPSINSPWYAGHNNWHPPLWLKNDPDFALKYWHAFYWGAGMCLGMVPRDIEPITSLEAIVTTLTMFVGLLLAAFVISSFTSAFAAMDQKNALAGKQLDLIRNYLLLKAVPTDLRSRILEFYQYLYTSNQSMDGLQVLNMMPPNLSSQLALSVNAKIITRTSMFADLSDYPLLAVISCLSPVIFVPGQILCTAGHVLRQIYFISRGQVGLRCGLGLAFGPSRSTAVTRGGEALARPLEATAGTPSPSPSLSC